jgi:hypothetical protein
MKKTLGSISQDLLKTDNTVINPQEIQRAQEQEYLDNLVWCVKHARKEVDCSTIENHEACKDRVPLEGSFFVACLLKKEKLLENVLRNYFVATKSCPTPCYDQTVFRYNHEKGDIEYIWTVPDRETCLTFKENKNIIVPSEQALLKNILDFYSGALYRQAKEFNGEQMHLGGELKGNKIWHTVNQ